MSDDEGRRRSFAALAAMLEEEHSLRGLPLRQQVIVYLGGMLEIGPVELPDAVGQYIAARLLPILEAEEAARRGRPGASGAGEMVQAYMDGGMDQAEARRFVMHRTGLKLESIAAAHRRFLKTGRKAMLRKTYTNAVVPR